MKISKKDAVVIVGYIIFGVLTRTVLHIAPNVEFVTALTIVGAYLIRSKYSFTIPLSIMIISDLIIGNSSIFLFTWSAYGIAWLFGKIIASRSQDNLGKGLLMSEFGGVIFTLFFFVWTNFGVVVVSNLYPKTLEGVLQSYIMGVPFLIPQLVGNVLIIPGIFLISSLIFNPDIFQKAKLLAREK